MPYPVLGEMCPPRMEKKTLNSLPSLVSEPFRGILELRPEQELESPRRGCPAERAPGFSQGSSGTSWIPEPLAPKITGSFGCDLSILDRQNPTQEVGN